MSITTQDVRNNLNRLIITDSSDNIRYDIEWLVVRAIHHHYPDDYDCFRRRTVLDQPNLARSLVMRNNGLLLRSLRHKELKTLSSAKKFISYLRFTPSDFVAVGVPWPQ